MTRKRFVNKGKDIFQYGEWWCSANGEHCADVIATAINELIEENEQLKYGNKNLKAILNDFMDICNRLQSNPNDKQTLNVTRDMLQNMGVDLE